MSSSGFKNLRAMFEQNKANQPPSGSTTPNRELSPKPLNRVRTSFVAVANGGVLGLQKVGSPGGANTTVSIAEGAKLAGESVDKDRIVPPEETVKANEGQPSKAEKSVETMVPHVEDKGEPVVKTDEEKKSDTTNDASVTKNEANPAEKLVSKAVKASTESKAAPPKEKVKAAPSVKPSTDKKADKPTIDKKIAEKPSATEKKTAEKTAEKAAEKKPTDSKPSASQSKQATSKPATVKPTASRPASAATSKPASNSMPPPSTRPAPRPLASTRKTPVGTPLQSPRVPATSRPSTAKASTSAAAKPKATERSSAAPKARAATATGSRAKTPTASEAPRRPTTAAISATSRLFAPTAASAARLADDKDKAKTIATSTASRRPASVATHRPKSSLATSRAGDARPTANRTATNAKTAPAKKAPAKPATTQTTAIPPPPPEEVIERLSRPTASSASKAISKEELAEISSRSQSRVSQHTHSRRVSVGSSNTSGSSPGKRRMSSQSPPRVIVSPGAEGEEAPIIEEKDEEQEETITATAEGDKTPRPTALELNVGEKVENLDVNTPSSDTTLVHDELEAQAAAKGEDVPEAMEREVAA
ncbi:hypothetical protein BDZ91DRAFT_475004 [Kalaharituber pfeilii]|nr:hypothetical protein BDZ91DRAFT_475004 [Kalaharituber pfeilii]